MTLRQWTENRWLRPHKTSRKEILHLLKYEIDLKQFPLSIFVILPHNMET